MTNDVHNKGRPEFVVGRRDAAQLQHWLADAVEEPLEPNLPTIDAHHHLWARFPYPYSRMDFLSEVREGLSLRATVHVECSSAYRKDGPVEMRTVGETESIVNQCSAEIEAGGPRIAAGIVGHADLGLGAAVRDVLEAHIVAGQGRFRGVRVRTMREEWLHGSRQPPAGMLADPQFRQGFALLASLGLSYDAYLYFHQIDELVDLARAFPETVIILNHVGGILGVGPWAGQAQQVFRHWRDALQRLSKCPNVNVKIGGLGMPCGGFDYAVGDAPADSWRLSEAWRPYIHACIETFGADRCMFESNFPIDKQTCSYTALWNAFKRTTKDGSAAERAALFHDTANRVYRLGEQACALKSMTNRQGDIA